MHYYAVREYPMSNRFSRWLRKRASPERRLEKEADVRAQLEQQVSRQLVELIAYMDRLGVNRKPSPMPPPATGEPLH